MTIPAVVTQTAFVGVLLNIFLACLLSPFATPEQVKPPDGAASLGMFSQFMHMIVHHKQVLFMSSLIVFVVVFASRLFEHYFFPFCPKENNYMQTAGAAALTKSMQDSTGGDPYFQNFQYMK